MQARAPYLFEPVLAIRPNAHVALFVSPPNLLLGAVIALLVAANIALVTFSTQRASCSRTGYARLASVFPAFLLGFACCAPTILLAMGGAAAATLLPFLLPLRPIFYPLAVGLLCATALVTTRQLRRRGVTRP